MSDFFIFKLFSNIEFYLSCRLPFCFWFGYEKRSRAGDWQGFAFYRNFSIVWNKKKLIFCIGPKSSFFLLSSDINLSDFFSIVSIRGKNIRRSNLKSKTTNWTQIRKMIYANSEPSYSIQAQRLDLLKRLHTINLFNTSIMSNIRYLKSTFELVIPFYVYIIWCTRIYTLHENANEKWEFCSWDRISWIPT